MNETHNTVTSRKEHDDAKSPQRSSDNRPGGSIASVIIRYLVLILIIWLILQGIEGSAGAPAAGGSRVPYWLGGLFAVMGGAIGVALAWSWAMKVSSWRRYVTFLIMACLVAIAWVSVFMGFLGVLPAIAIHVVLIILSWFGCRNGSDGLGSEAMYALGA